MNLIGVNTYHADAAVALIQDGRLTFAAEEERYSRCKHAAGFPAQALRAAMEAADLRPADLDHMAISRDPRAHLYRRVAANLRKGLRAASSRAANLSRLFDVRDDLERALGVSSLAARLHAVEHHRAHLASAFFVSPFEEAAVVSVDGLGDFCSAMWASGQENRLKVLGWVEFPHSLGFFYTAFTQLLGLPKYGDEYKLMGLSAYGQPRYAAQVRQVVQVKDDGQIRLNLDYFVHHTQGVAMNWGVGEPALGTIYSPKLVADFGPERVPRSEFDERHADLAASVQLVLEECYLKLLRAVHSATRSTAVCLAGGVALNCVANGKIRSETPFRDVYVQGAAADSGTALGAAFYVQHQILNVPRSYVMDSASLGPEFTDEAIAAALLERGLHSQIFAQPELLHRTAAAIAEGLVVGWFQGRMEFGPRALGQRSILADPRRPDMKDTLNRRIKFREPFRPFCPSILAEATGEFFEDEYASPFMVMAYRIRPEQRARIPAVTHQDGTGRLQTVTRSASPLYYALIEEFGRQTGVPILLNTSFNENEPVVHTPQQAIDCFLRTHMDALAIGRHWVSKADVASSRQGAISTVAPAGD